MADARTPPEGAIAVVGMAGRFPGARGIREFWRNLRDGVESIASFSERDLAESGLGPEVARHPDYVPRRGALDDVDLFDAGFFDFSPYEAEVTDPQHRLFLECAWQALEHAGYDTFRYPGRIAVFAGQSLNSYLLHGMVRNPALLSSFYLDQLPALAGGSEDFLATRVAYKLNLRGPAIRVQTACSTSLVAIHLACQSLLSGECDMALAGGVSVQVPQRLGYVHRTGDVMSRDGRCRAFDRASTGVVGGSGLGVVVLERLEEAIANGDHVLAVVRGTAVNNDGSAKVGFAAPGVEGQAAVIAEALAVADTPADTIGYVEAHGTGTPLGDPIEVRALTRAFRDGTERVGFCAIGSVKTNIGHLDAAAGVAGFIKAVLALEHRRIPPSLHFTEPNPELGIEDSPFYVNAGLADWPAAGTPRRAGVSSFGIGGTNAHAVLEEAPPAAPSGPSRPWQLLPLSARAPAALRRMAADLADHLLAEPDVDLADVAHTLRVGRRQLPCRIAIVCRDRDDAVERLTDPDAAPVADLRSRPPARSLAFLFPGQGSQHAGMAGGLYRAEPGFADAFDRCAELLLPQLGVDLRALLLGGGGFAEERLDETWLTQPALFTVEYATARLLAEWGVRPAAMIGHSVGEYVAACLAGVFSLPDALALVAARGRLLQSLPEGRMLAAPLDAEEAREVAGPDLDVAAVNGPASCVLSGSPAAVAAAEERLAGRGIAGRRLRVTRAFHSAMVEPVLDAFAELVAHVERAAPELPFVSNVSGAWITPEQAVDPGYWREHLRRPVRFRDGIERLRELTGAVLLEVGPGQALTALAGQDPAVTALATAPHPRDGQPDVAHLLRTAGRLWLSGVELDWAGFAAHERRRRVPLPGYPFERRRYWLGEAAPEPAAPATSGVPAGPAPARPGSDLGRAGHERPQLATAYVPPGDETEEAVAGVWRHLLGYDRVGVDDNFFALGGNSLLSARLLAMLQDELGVELPFDRLYQAQTVAEQAALVRELR